MRTATELLATYGKLRLLRILCLGFASGLPLALTASTLFTWLADVGVDKASIGLFASIATPYSLKFLWSSFLDAGAFPWWVRGLGRRRSWLVVIQSALILAIICLAYTDPVQHALLFAAVACVIAFLSASQDIVIDAYRVESVPVEEQGAAAAMVNLGYRLAMLVSGAGALWLSDQISWTQTYLAMAACMLPLVWVSLRMPEPELVITRPKDIKEFVIAPFVDFMRRKGWLTIVIFVVLFKLADAFLGVMFNPFLLDIGFTKTQIAQIVKLYGLLATIIGTFAGGACVTRYGTYRVLIATTFLHMLTNLLLVVQVDMGAHEGFLKLCVITENFTGGMGTAAFVAYLSALCHKQFTATQYALLSSLAAVARTVLSTASGQAAAWWGWSVFFAFSSLLAVPALIMLVVCHKTLMQKDEKDAQSETGHP